MSHYDAMEILWQTETTYHRIIECPGLEGALKVI